MKMKVNKISKKLKSFNKKQMGLIKLSKSPKNTILLARILQKSPMYMKASSATLKQWVCWSFCQAKMPRREVNTCSQKNG